MARRAACPLARAMAICLPAGAADRHFGRHAMFEDSTFESTGRIRTRSRGWMIASFAFNGSILLALILLPLIYPDALPRQFIAHLMEAPPPPTPPTPTRPEPVRARTIQTELTNTGSIQAPSRIPIHILDITTR